MKRFTTISALFMLMLFLSTSVLYAQSNNFDGDTLGQPYGTTSWQAGDISATVDSLVIDTVTYSNVLKVEVNNYNAAPFLAFTIPGGLTLADYDTLSFSGYFATGDVGYKTISAVVSEDSLSGPFLDDSGENDVIGSVDRSMGASTGWEEIKIPIDNDRTELSGTVYIGFGISAAGTANSENTVWYADNVALNAIPIELSSGPITAWARDASYNAWPIIKDGSTPAGSASLGAETTIAGGSWAGLRGAFAPITATEGAGNAFVITGKMELNASLGSGYTPLRYALTNHEEMGIIANENTADAVWNGTSSGSGYSFIPLSGAGTLANGGGGSGTVWTINSGNWLSTYSNNGGPAGTFYQIPALAEIGAGVYDWAISVQPVGDGMSEIRFLLIHEDDDYYFAGTTMAETTSSTFNSIAFGFQGFDTVEDFTQVDFSEVEAVNDDPIEIPTPAFFDHFMAIERFGFIGGKVGGDWTLTPGDFTGNTSISGTAGADTAALRSGFDVPFTTTSDEALVIEAEVTFEGGGFGEDGSFKFGVFSASDPGSVDSTEANGYTWNGSEAGHSGYLFTPGSGVDAIVDGVWYDASGSGAYSVEEHEDTGTPAAGTYDLAISLQSTSAGMDIRYSLTSEDGYVFEYATVDADGSFESFEAINFAISNSTTTGMSIADLEISSGAAITVSNEVVDNSQLPKSFSLGQNYPNPFNPTTNINFDLPQAADVQLTVFNMLGQRVMTLVDNRMEAGAHKVTFDARNLASGMYMYRIEAGSFINTKKMMLIK
tara:strand:- start:7062 stop:9383 length:2322 start_codon:yes stop_codon:yes gene_type:complete